MITLIALIALIIYWHMIRDIYTQAERVRVFSSTHTPPANNPNNPNNPHTQPKPKHTRSEGSESLLEAMEKPSLETWVSNPDNLS